MKKLPAFALSVLAAGLLSGCAESEAEKQQNAKIEALQSEITRLRSDLDDSRMEISRYRDKINLITDWLRKKVEEEKRAKIPKMPPATSPKSSTGSKTGAAGSGKAADTAKKKIL